MILRAVLDFLIPRVSVTLRSISRSYLLSTGLESPIMQIGGPGRGYLTCARPLPLGATPKTGELMHETSLSRN